MILLKSGDYTVRMRDDLPASVPAFISESPDGHLNIYLNARLSHNKQREGLKHEIDHHLRDDLHNGLDIHDVEAPERKTKQRPLPPVFRASQLLTRETHESEIQYKRTIRFDARYKPKPTKHIPPEAIRPVSMPPTYQQRKIILQAINELDRYFFDNDFNLENRMILRDDY